LTSFFQKIFCSACFLLCLCVASSQDLIYKHYDLQDGLASPTIHSIFQDRDGFLWFGTESGLCRYDGTRFKTFTVKDGLADNEVLGMFQDRKGRIWLQQYSTNIAYIFNGKIYTRENDPVLKQIKLTSWIHGIAEDSEGNIGLCDLETLYIILNGYKTIKSIHSIDGKPLQSVNLYTDNDGKLVICARNSLYKVENYGLKYMRRVTREKDAFGPTSVLLHPNYIMNGYHDTIFLRDTAIHYKLPARILKFSPISDSLFSINTADGALLFNINDYSSVKILPGIRVTNVFMDKEKNLWIGTQGMGIYKMGSPVIVNNAISDNENDISYISKEKNKIIVGNNSGKIYEYEGNRFNKRVIHGIKEWDMRGIIYDEPRKEDKYFLAHLNGILNHEKGIVANRLIMIMLKRIAPINKDHVLAAAQSGVFIIRKNDLSIIDTIWKRKSLCAFKTGDSVLIGTLAGLFVVRGSKGNRVIVDSMLHSSIIYFVEKTANNLLWVGTFANGLYCFKDGQLLRHFTDSVGLPSNNCKSVYIKDDTIWLGTDKGLVKITQKGDYFRLQKYSISDGLPSNIINSIYVDGHITYIGTPAGLCYFDENLVETASICNLILTGVKVGDTPVELSDRYSLNRRQRLVIEYSGISFRSEQEVNYRYRINGIDNNWQNTNLNSLEFTSLPYGDYELEIVATNKFGKDSLPLKIKLHIIRPFHKTTWFIVGLVLLPVLLAVFYYNYRVSQVKRKQVQKLQQEIKMLELEQMALRAQMNPHFIFNCISVMQQLVRENDTARADRFVTSFANLVRQTLNNAPELFIPLHEEIRFLTSYFELERIRLEDRFSYAIDATAIENLAQWRVPNMVIQPFVENAIGHGIRYKKDGKGLIELRFEQQDDSLRCTITDNGIGREKAEQIKRELGIQHVSKGMGITFKRIQSLNAITNRKISIVIEDLKDKDQNASGTKVVIEFYKIRHNDKDNYYR
jgi:hypothetical protein